MGPSRPVDQIVTDDRVDVNDSFCLRDFAVADMNRNFE